VYVYVGSVLFSFGLRVVAVVAFSFAPAAFQIPFSPGHANSVPLPEDEPEVLYRAQVLYEFSATREEQLDLKVGEIISILGNHEVCTASTGCDVVFGSLLFSVFVFVWVLPATNRTQHSALLCM
jgi:hypothetical protein